MQDHPPTAAKVEGPRSNARESAIPKSDRPTTAAQRVKSHIRKILLANPLFPRFYADVVISSAHNSNEAKILRDNYSKILSQVKLNMANNSSCTHIKVTGVRCGSPALHGEQFCYFHQRVHRGVRTPPQARLHPIALIEDEESIQMALMEVINALMRNTIDLKRATLILRALHIAVKNARRVRFNAKNDMVKEVPEFAAPDTSVAEQAEAEQSLRIPPYNPDASKPGYIRTAAERKRDGDLPRSNETQESRDELIAHYYGYPSAAAHAAALAAQKTEVKGVSVERTSVERAPTPANAKANGGLSHVGQAAPAREAASQRDTNRSPKKPPTGMRTTPPGRNKAQRASIG